VTVGMPVLLLPTAGVLIFLVLKLSGVEWRRSLIQSLLTVSVLIAVTTEALSLFSAIERYALECVWGAVCAIAFLALLWVIRVRGIPILPRTTTAGGIEVLCVLGIASVLCPVVVAARLGPPNVVDVLAYHMPRVFFWAQQRSVAFFPTSFPQQIVLQPLNEYALLHTYVLSGSDRYVNLVQSAAFLCLIVVVSLITMRLGGGVRAQAIAALLCATIPTAILQASGTKNDMTLTFFIAGTVYFLLCYAQDRKQIDLWAGAVSSSLALLTKATACIFLPPLLAAIFLICSTEGRWLLRGVPVLIGCVLAINGPQFARCYAYSGSPLGLISVYDDGSYRFANDRFSLKVTISNVLRNLALHFGRGRLRRAVDAVQIKAGINPVDPATTWPGTHLEATPDWCQAHEMCAPSPIHAAMLLIVTPILLILTRDCRRVWMLYYAGIIGMFVAFCTLLRWQPWHSRMHLPILALGSVVVGALVASFDRLWLQMVFLVVLIVPSQRLAYSNNRRPLIGNYSVFERSRTEMYFYDQMNDEPAFLAAVDAVRKTGCTDVGIDNTYNRLTGDPRKPPLEYPLLELIREAVPRVRFTHVGVHNRSAKYSARMPFSAPCVIVCLSCGADKTKSKQYEFGMPPLILGELGVFTGSGNPKPRT
jgi:hypothetical protein